MFEQAPIVNQNGPNTNFKGAGHSHFSYLEPGPGITNPGFHETTNIPGFGKKMGLDNGLSVHTDIGGMNGNPFP